MRNKTIKKILKKLEKELNEKFTLNEERLKKASFKITAFHSQDSTFYNKDSSLERICIDIKL